MKLVRLNGPEAPLTSVPKQGWALESDGAMRTEQRDREQAARQNAEEQLCSLRKALDAIRIGVTITDTERRIVYVNAADAAMHGYTPAELIGQRVEIFSRAENRSPLAPERLRQLSSWSRESTNVRKDGSAFPVQLLSDIVRGANGEPIGVVTTCEDITEQKLVEERLRTALRDLGLRVAARDEELSVAYVKLGVEAAERQALEALLRQAQKLEAIGQLSGGIAHNFNNLLTIVLTNLELIETAFRSAGDEVAGALADIRAAADSGAAMVQRLLGFSRQAQLRIQPLDPGRVVVDVADMLQPLLPDHVELETVVDEGAGIIKADASALQQIVINLVTNARDAMPDGGRLRISVARAPVERDRRGQASASPKAYVRLSVQDTGIGMTDEVKARIFDPFFTTKPPGKGTGLGLAMTYGLVKQQAGFIEVDTTPGKGTTMSLYFPLAENGAAAAIPGQGPGEVPRGTETIPLVEDEESLRRATQRVLERLGYRVLGAADGAEALELFRAHRATIDLILSDVVMPRLGGVDLYQAIRREDAAVRFALVTGYAERDVGRDGKLDPRVPLIFKPWTVPDLARHVRKTLDRAA